MNSINILYNKKIRLFYNKKHYFLVTQNILCIYASI